MKVIFCSMMFSNIEEDIKRSKNPNSVSGHKYQENLLRGFLENNIDIYVINTPRIRTFPNDSKIVVSKEKFILDNKVVGENIGYLNVKGINYFIQIAKIYIAVEREIIRCKGDKCILLVFNTHVAQSIAIQKLKEKYPNVISCDAIGDIYGNFGVSNTEKSIKRVIVDNIHKKQDELALNFDSYILVTEYIADVINARNKPFVVIEGLYRSKVSTHNNSNMDETKRVFYAGSLTKEYGIEHLLNAFSMIKDDNYELIIAGNGDGVPMVKYRAENDKRIKYLGVISPSEVEKYQNSATVLISPRQNNQKFIKYSFPSKTLECLASGTPYIAHKLSCEPSEYADYIQYAYDESDYELSKKIVEICSFDFNKRRAIGKLAKEFVESHKNPKAMCKKAIELWDSIEV